MKNLYPKRIRATLDSLHDEYIEKVQQLAEEVMTDRVKPILDKQSLSFCMMNGFPQCYDSTGNPAELPKVLENMLDITDAEGTLFMYHLPDYNPTNQNFSELDIKKFKERIKHCTEEQAALSLWQTAHLY